MHFSKKKIKEFFGIDILNKHLDDIEGYLDMKSEELKRKKEKKKRAIVKDVQEKRIRNGL